ncbi:MAG: helix-turn-helix domain-containing protein [Pseudomonadota bacterium]
MIRAEDRPSDAAEWATAGDIVISVTARAFQVPPEAFFLQRRSTAEVAFARQVAMYLFHIVFGGTYKDVGVFFGRERTTVAYACSLVEDERDDAKLDKKLDRLEETLDRLWAIDRLRKVKEKKAKGLGRAAA